MPNKKKFAAKSKKPVSIKKTSASVSRSIHKVSYFSSKQFLKVLFLLLMLLGIAATVVLSQIRQDVRQQAYEGNNRSQLSTCTETCTVSTGCNCPKSNDELGTHSLCNRNSATKDGTCGGNVPTLSSCTQSCTNANGCKCANECVYNFAGTNSTCGGIESVNLSSCTEVCTSSQGCNCPKVNDAQGTHSACNRNSAVLNSTCGGNVPILSSCTQVCTSGNGCKCQSTCTYTFAGTNATCGGLK